MTRKPPPPPPDGHYRCTSCKQTYLIGTGAPSRTRPGVTLKSSCSVACRDKLNATYRKYGGSDKGKAARVKHKTSDKGKAGNKRSHDVKTAKRRTCPKAKLKYCLSEAARKIWTGQMFIKTNKCTVLATHTRFKTPSALRKVLRDYAEEADMEIGVGTIAHRVIPQFWYDFGNPEDVRRCWDAQNLGVQIRSQNISESWLLNPVLISAHPAELFPTAYPKDVLLAAACKDDGIDLHSEVVLARAQAEA